MQSQLLQATVVTLASLSIVAATPTPAFPPFATFNPIPVTPPQPTRTLSPTSSSSSWAGLIGGIYICTLPSYQGTCTYFQVPHMRECWNLSPEWTDVVSSFSPDKADAEQLGTDLFEFTCAIYSEVGCKGDREVQKWPGIGDLTIGGNMNKRGKSLQCNFDSEAMGGWSWY